MIAMPNNSSKCTRDFSGIYGCADNDESPNYDLFCKLRVQNSTSG